MTALIIFHFAICFFLVCVILLQPGKSDAGIGFGSSSQSIFGSRGAGNFLTKTTSVCAVVFLLTSFLLTRDRIQQYNGSVIGNEPATAPATPKASTGDTGKTPDAKTAPAAEPSKKK